MCRRSWGETWAHAPWSLDYLRVRTSGWRINRVSVVIADGANHERVHDISWVVLGSLHHEFDKGRLIIMSLINSWWAGFTHVPLVHRALVYATTCTDANLLLRHRTRQRGLYSEQPSGKNMSSHQVITPYGVITQFPKNGRLFTPKMTCSHHQSFW